MSATCLYEPKVISRIPEASFEQAESPGELKLICLARCGSLCVATDNVLHVLDTGFHGDKNGTVEQNGTTMAFKFECLVDAVGWSSDGSLLVAGDRQGVLHFVSPVVQTVLFSQALENIAVKNEEHDKTVFRAIEFAPTSSEGVMDLLVLSTSGKVFVFRRVGILRISQAIESRDSEALEKLRGEIELVTLDLSEVHCEKPSSLHPLLPPSSSDTESLPSLITCGRGDSALSIWHRVDATDDGGYILEDSVGSLLQGLGVEKCETSMDGKFLVTLDSSEILEIWLLSSLVVVNVWTSSKVKHFSLCGGTSCETGVQVDGSRCSDRLCLITEDSTGKWELRIVSLPDFDPIHSMPVTSGAVLFTGDISEDSLYYLDVDQSGEKGSVVMVKQLVLALPENRLATLLTHQKFEEAEAFARQFDLDPELVFKSKAKVLNSLLCRASSEGESEMATSSLLECLGHIKEDAFIVNLVLRSLYPTLDSTLQLLQYTHKKLQRSDLKTNDDTSIKSKVTSALNKLITFQMIHSDWFNPQAWQLFLEGCMLNHLRHCLQLGDLQKASCIWSRHLPALVNELDANNLLPLLECIPDSVLSLSLSFWLAHHVVPFLLEHTPQALGDFLRYVEERVRLLELTEKEGWPGNGLEMSAKLIEAVCSFRSQVAKMTIQPHALSIMDFSTEDHASPLSSLKSLQKRLGDLCYLHTSLKCPITLSDHEKESQEAVVFRLLDEVIAAELVTTTIRSKVIPYIDRHQMQLSSTLLNYIKLFLSQSHRYSTGLIDSPFESKAIALVQAIQDKELYVKGCVELLKHVQTPWSESVEELVQECLNVEHPVVAMLEKQYALLKLKKLLQGYGIRDFNFSDTSKGWLYIRRILISEGPSILMDALKVGEMYQLCVLDIYKHHLMNLGQRNNIEEAIELLQRLDKEEQLMTAEKTFSLASSLLHLPFSHDLDDPNQYMGAAKVAILCLKTMESVSKKGRSCVLTEDWSHIADMTDLFQRLHALQVEFSMFLTPSELGDFSRCRQLFKDRVKDMNGSKKLPKSDHSTKRYHDTIRFCQLLGYSAEKVYEELALQCAREGQLDQAVNICRDLIKSSPTPSTAQPVMTTVQEMWDKTHCNPESLNNERVQAIQQLAAHATALCHKCALLDAVEMHRLCVFIARLYQQCESGVTDERNNCGLEFLEWRWSPRFKEDGLVLDPTSLLSTALRYTLTRLPHLNNDHLRDVKRSLHCLSPRQASLSKGDIQPLLSVSGQLSQLLQDNGHSQLTLQCSAQTLAAYSQHIATTAATGGPSCYPIFQQGHTINKGLLNGLVTKLLSSRRLDHDYALSLLLMLPRHMTTNKLKAIRTKSISSFSKVIALCKLTIDYSILVQEPTIKEHSVAILTSAQWGKRLGGHKISFTEAFRGGMDEKKKVASTLFRNKHVETELILDYCREMLNFDPQSVLASYLRILLTEWEDGHAYQERAALVIRQIKNRDMVNQMLLNLLLNRIKPYDYDRIAFMLSHLVGVTTAASIRPEQGLVLLDCLKHYTRISTPSDYEKSFFASKYCQQPPTSEQQQKEEQLVAVEVELPEAASRHLPFHLLLCGPPMKVIEPELMSPANVEKLIPISRILQLPADEFYSCAIKNIVTTALQQSGKDSTDFTVMSQYLVKIQDFQYALGICKWLAKQLPKDEDRIDILKSGLDLALQYGKQAKTEQERKSAEEKAGMFHELLRITQTDQVLKRHNLDTPDYLELSRLGASLLLTLYTDLPVAKTTPIVSVHSIAAEIAKIHKINLDKIINKLTEQWLLSTSSSSTDMNVTQTSLLEDPTEESSDGEESEESLNMKRLVYLLNVPDKLEKHSVMLLRWAQNSSSAGGMSRVRALQILFTIAPPGLIERVSGKSVGEIKDLMQCMMFVAELEALHMSTKLPAFQSCSKEGLVRTLWRNHSQEPRALRLVCELCLYYHIRDPSLWSSLLEQLLTLDMIPYLKHVLRVLASLSGHSNIPTLPLIWQKALLSTLQEVTPPLSDYHKQECTNTLEMLFSCPFPFELNVSEVVKGFCSIGLYSHAVASLLVIPSQTNRQKMLIQTLKSFTCKEQYVLLLDELDTLSQSTSGQFKEAAGLVYMHLNSKEKHELLLGSSHFTPFMHYLISKKLMKSLVTKTLQLNRVKDAVQLIEMYNSKHNPQTQLHGLDALQEFLTANGINGFDSSLLLFETS